MNKKQAILLSLLLTFGAAAANDNGGTEPKASSGVESNEGVKANAAPIVLAGDVGDAIDASRGDKFAIHISGGELSQKSAKEYAKVLANAFADRRFTDKPMYITVTHEETSKERASLAIVYMDGVRYSYNDVATFTPEQVGGAIKIISNDFVDEHGNHLVLPEDVEPVVIASLN